MINSQVDTQPPAHARPAGTVCTLVLCLILSIVIAALFALCRGEVRTGFHKASLDRFSDIGQFALPKVYGTIDDSHPVLSFYVERNKTFGATLAVALVRAGLSFETAVSLVSLIYRSFFGVAISWLAFAATGKRSIGLLGVFLAFGLPNNAVVYGYTPALSAVTGVFATSVFLVACSLCLLRLRSLSLLVWVFQLWVHPITFVCWSPAFLGLYVASSFKRKTSTKLIIIYLSLLAGGPLAVGALSGLLEAGGWLPIQGDEYYWALVRTKTYHSVFLFSSKYAAPVQYISQVAALMLLAFAGKATSSPLRRLNVLCAFLGLGLGLMYAGTVETHFSVLANFCLPLRFESVMYPVLIANVLHILFNTDSRRIGERALSAAYGALLLFPSLMPLFWAGTWAAGIAWFQAERKNTRVYLGLTMVGAAASLIYLVLAPSNEVWLLSKMVYTMSYVKGLVWFVVALAVSLGIRSMGSRATHAVAWAAVLLIPTPSWFLQFRTLAYEWEALVHNLPESSPEKEACDWINGNIPKGATILVAPNLYLHYATHVKTSIELELVGFFIYAPAMAKSIADEVNRLYGVDVVEMARRHERLGLSYQDWYRLRRGVLEGTHPARDDFQFIGEPAEVTPAVGGTIVFANEYLRVYSLVKKRAPVQQQ